MGHARKAIAFTLRPAGATLTASVHASYLDEN